MTYRIICLWSEIEWSKIKCYIVPTGIYNPGLYVLLESYGWLALRHFSVTAHVQ